MLRRHIPRRAEPIAGRIARLQGVERAEDVPDADLARVIGGPIIEGDGATATFSVPAGIAVDDDGVLYVADGPRIRKIVWQ